LEIMTAEFAPPATSPSGTVADELALIQTVLDRIRLSDYAGQSPEQARENAATLRRIESRVATHVGVAVRAVATSSPG